MKQSSQTAVTLLGYALFITINATSIWGGVFPFLPTNMQGTQTITAFFYAQAISMCVTFVAITALIFQHHARLHTVPVAAAVVPMFIGTSCLVAVMYLHAIAAALVIAAGIFQGIGAACFFTVWETCFSAQSLNRGGLLLVLGTALAAVFYFLLYLVPIAVTAFLIPLILVPLCGLCLSLERRSLDLEQPMFEDDPREHRRVYRWMGRVYWKSAICIGTLGFTCGIIRAIAVNNAVVGDIVNVASMIGSLIGALILIAVWNRHTFRISVYASFRVLYPFLITAFLLLPFLGMGYLDLFAGITFMIFSFAIMIMMVHCIQISHDSGVNPAIIYSFYAIIVYALQAIGFLFGLYSESISLMGLQPLSIVALGSVWVLSIALIICDKYPLRLHISKPMTAGSNIEFIALRREGAASLQAMKRAAEDADAKSGAAADARDGAATGAEGAAAAVAMAADKRASKSTRRIDTTFDMDDQTEPVIKDRISKQCMVLKEHYGLTSRETTIMEYIARGFSVSSISKKLVISDNTVRAHSKHIYTKLDIHKRQELLDLIESF